MFLLRYSAIAALGALALGAAPAASAKTQVAIGGTADINSTNPYSDSAAWMYSVWCNIYGCLCRYDNQKGEYAPLLATKWEVDPNDRKIWTFHLRTDIRSHSGAPLTATDVVHTINRIKTDPRSAQKSNTRPIKEATAVDAHTVRLETTTPTAPLLQYICDSYAISRKEVFDKHGAQEADRRHPDGFGPYRMTEFQIGARVVMEKMPGHPLAGENSPDVLIWRKIQEPEARVTGLLNGELQIATYIPPHLMPRIEANPKTKLGYTESVEIMFLAMNPKFKPWDNKKLRQAVAHAIDREALAKNVLGGMAVPLHGPVGKGQIGYDPAMEQKLRIPFDPEKARALVKEAGFPDGVEVEFQTAVGRYVNDKHVAEAIVPMLAAVGIRAKLSTPEYSTYWPNIQRGRVPFYYMGRGSVTDPSPAIQQYFETGITPRIGYSNPEFDALLKAEREEFDDKKRRDILNRAFAILQDDVPALFMWRHRLADGIASHVDFQPPANGRIYSDAIKVKPQ